MESTTVILGAGQMGTAIAQSLTRNGKSCILWVRRNKLFQTLRSTRVNSDYLPGMVLNDAIEFSVDLEDVIPRADILIVAIPSSAITSFLDSASATIEKSNRPIVLSTIKGLPEGGNLTRTSEVLQKAFAHSPIAVFSGPNIAKELALGLPTTTTIACEDNIAAQKLQHILDSKELKVSLTDDVVGTELCGAFKNVVTIGVGLIDGLKLGENVKGIVVSQGFHEIAHLVLKSGGKKETLFSPAGLDDLLVASYSGKSRNYRFGHMIGEGYSFKQIQERFGHITFEGVKTVKLTYKLALELDVKTPLIESVHSLVEGITSPMEAFEMFWGKMDTRREIL